VVKGLVISTPLREEVELKDVYEGFTILIESYELRVDLIPLDMLDWLSMYHAKMYYYAKIIILKMINDDKFKFKNERNVMFNGLILMMTARKLIWKRCEDFLAYVKDVYKRGNELKDIPTIWEYPNVFPKELPGLLYRQEIKETIEVMPSTAPISQALYRIALIELVELKVQLKELLEKKVHMTQ